MTMFKISTDVRFTRRKRIHVIFDERDQLLWTGPNIDAAIEHLLNTGHTEATLEGPNTRYRITFQKLD